MKTIAFSKNKTNLTCPSLIELNMTENAKFSQELFMKGNIHIVSRSSYEESADCISRIAYLNCGIKRTEVELYRALQFHVKKVQGQPRRLIFETNNQGAFKRSINKFVNKWYEAKDPLCILITSDEMFDRMSEYYQSITYERNVQKSSGNDPINDLLKEMETNPLVQEVSKVYIGSSYEMKLARLKIFKAAQTKSPVLILGETGTGKDVIARLIFKLSIYNNKSFVVINCSAIPEPLFESEMYGHTKWAFSDAKVEKPGMFEIADKGTLFLDEVADLSMENQTKLLLACETKEFRRVGSVITQKSDVRIIAATNKNIFDMILQNRFRQDLFYRLNGINITAPSLHSHPQDIQQIAEKIWKEICPNGNLSRSFLELLSSNLWQGNVRELKSVLTSIFDLFGCTSPTPQHFNAVFINNRKNTENDV